MIKHLQYLVDGRLFEWTFSVGTLWLAVETFLYPDAIILGAFKRLVEIMYPETVTAYAFVVSICGLAALAANGRSFVVGPIVRSICAVCRAYLWGQFGYALFLLGQTQPSPSIGFGFWLIFTCAELYVAYRAMTDVSQRSL